MGYPNYFAGETFAVFVAFLFLELGYGRLQLFTVAVFAPEEPLPCENRIVLVSKIKNYLPAEVAYRTVIVNTKKWDAVCKYLRYWKIF